MASQKRREDTRNTQCAHCADSNYVVLCSFSSSRLCSFFSSVETSNLFKWCKTASRAGKENLVLSAWKISHRKQKIAEVVSPTQSQRDDETPPQKSISNPLETKGRRLIKSVRTLFGETVTSSTVGKRQEIFLTLWLYNISYQDHWNKVVFHKDIKIDTDAD